MEIEKGLDTGAVFAPPRRRSTTRRRLASCASDSARWAPIFSSTRCRPSRRSRPNHRWGAHVRRQVDGRGAQLTSRPSEALCPFGPEPAAGGVDDHRRTPLENFAARVWPTTVRSSPSKCSPKVRRACRATRGCAVVKVRPSGSVRDLLWLLARRAVRIEDGVYSQVLVPSMLRDSNLRDRDRGFATDLVYGTVRAQRRLDDLVTCAGEAAPPPARPSGGARAPPRHVPTAPLRSCAMPRSETVDALAASSGRAPGRQRRPARLLTRLGRRGPNRRATRSALVSRLARRAACP